MYGSECQQYQFSTSSVIYLVIYYSAWADQRRRMRYIHSAAATAGSILLSQGVYISTAREYIAESGVYIFNRKGVYC